LNRKGSKWDYVISDPTSSSAYKTERYALFEDSQPKENWESLVRKYHLEIDREPLLHFRIKKINLVVNFHVLKKSKTT
jgi:hypothetical protein